MTLITRQDYREGTLTREGVLITGDDVVTRQTAEAKWDIRRRERTDDLSQAMRDSMRLGGREESDPAGGDGRSAGGKGGKGRGRGRERGARGRGGGAFSQPKAWG